MLPSQEPQALDRSTMYMQLRTALLPEGIQHQSPFPKHDGMQNLSAKAAQQVQAVDLSQWLFQNTRQSEHVSVEMNIAGAEYDIIEKLIADGSALLINSINIVWHRELQPQKAEWPVHIEEALGRFNIQQNLQGIA